MPNVKRETWGAGDQSWLGSSHGIVNARTAHLDISAFPAAVYADGYVPSGTPVAEVNEVLVPYDSTSVEGAEVLAGFVLFDQSTAGGEDLNVPLFDHGRVFVDRLPIDGEFVKPSPENDATTCVFA